MFLDSQGLGANGKHDLSWQPKLPKKLLSIRNNNGYPLTTIAFRQLPDPLVHTHGNMHRHTQDSGGEDA